MLKRTTLRTVSIIFQDVPIVLQILGLISSTYLAAPVWPFIREYWLEITRDIWQGLGEFLFSIQLSEKVADYLTILALFSSLFISSILRPEREKIAALSISSVVLSLLLVYFVGYEIIAQNLSFWRTFFSTQFDLLLGLLRVFFAFFAFLILATLILAFGTQAYEQLKLWRLHWAVLNIALLLLALMMLCVSILQIFGLSPAFDQSDLQKLYDFTLSVLRVYETTLLSLMMLLFGGALIFVVIDRFNEGSLLPHKGEGVRVGIGSAVSPLVFMYLFITAIQVTDGISVMIGLMVLLCIIGTAQNSPSRIVRLGVVFAFFVAAHFVTGFVEAAINIIERRYG